MKNNQKLEVHPAAEVFPMLPDDELQELAADIKANGLLETIKTSHGQLIDGRNRLAACGIAGIEPQFEELDGTIDPVTFILSTNITRRHLTKGQRAMAVAMIYPEVATTKRKGSGSFLGKDQFSEKQISQARTILTVLPEVATQVRDGAISLNEAYEKAKIQRDSVTDRKTILESLRSQAPDLAELVDEERMKLIEAVAAMEERKRDERSQRQAIYGLLEKEKVFASSLEGANLEHLIAIIRKYPEECSMTEIKKLADRLETGWSNLKKGLR